MRPSGPCLQECRMWCRRWPSPPHHVYPRGAPLRWMPPCGAWRSPNLHSHTHSLLPPLPPRLCALLAPACRSADEKPALVPSPACVPSWDPAPADALWRLAFPNPPLHTHIHSRPPTPPSPFGGMWTLALRVHVDPSAWNVDPNASLRACGPFPPVGARTLSCLRLRGPSHPGMWTPTP